MAFDAPKVARLSRRGAATGREALPVCRWQRLQVKLGSSYTRRRQLTLIWITDLDRRVGSPSRITGVVLTPDVVREPPRRRVEFARRAKTREFA